LSAALQEKFTFKTEMDDEARHNMFKHQSINGCNRS